MYRPDLFDEPRPAVLRALIGDIGMAMLVSHGADGFEASHLPLMVDAEPAPHGSLVGHLARANPHWRRLAGAEVLAIFQGPNGYVSPNWYASKQRNPKVVPTWNYVAVHATGHAETFDEPEALRAVVARLTNAHEARFAAPWSLDDAPEDFVAAMLGGIVGVRIRISRLEGKRKLSQNRPPEDRASVLAALQASARPADAALAEAMAAAASQELEQRGQYT